MRKTLLHFVCVMLLLGLAGVPFGDSATAAVSPIKISSYGDGHQLWFEAEHFDERNPDSADYAPVVDMEGVFGQAVGRTGPGGGMMRWTFDISVAGGEGGTWYFWGRVLNPNNRSDFMLVEGDPGDMPIPTGPPFPSGSSAPEFVQGDDRVFEETRTEWDWIHAGHEEGHTKELQDGENTMYIFRREGPNATVFWDVFMWTDDPDYIPTDDDYRNAAVPVAGTASDPDPTGTYVPRDVILSWTAGDFASRHDVYFGTDPAAVAQATPSVDPGGVYQGRIDATTYSPPRLDYEQTYYWRIDEVNAPPDSTIIKGNVWSFTAEPALYPLTGIIATASSYDEGFGPENTVNGSGLTDGEHSTEDAAMWVSSKTETELAQIQYEFDGIYKLHEMRVWNYNVIWESVLGFGFKDVAVEYSRDGVEWMALPDQQFAQGTGQDAYAANTTVDFGGVGAKYVRLTAKSNWGDLRKQYGLSEVQFYYIPVNAGQPEPAAGATGVDVGTVLSWRAGREAGSHDVYFGTDSQAVADGTAPVETVAASSYDPGPLAFGATYYWKVVEVNEAETPSSWESEVWSFATQEYLVVEDFESYTDDEGSRIYETWIDGWTNNTGSVVGYLQAPFAERWIVNGGRQSMPFEYNNVGSPYYSEAERTWDTTQDWTVSGVDTLMLYFRGNPPAFSEAAGTITMSAGGVDIWNTADEFRFASKRLNGDGSMVVKVESLENSDPWAKSGIMIRDNLTPGAKNAMAYVTPDGRVGWQFRQLIGGTSDSTRSDPGTITLPYWVRMTRTGTELKAEHSSDGTTWEPMVEVANPSEPTARDIGMGSTVYIGLAVTSHNPSATTTAVFSEVSSTSGVSGAWDVQAIGVAQPSNDPAPLYVTIQDSAGKSQTVSHSDPAATTLPTWQPWPIPLSEFSSGGVNLARVKTMIIGVGDRAQPTPDGAGLLFIDDIGVGHPAN